MSCIIDINYIFINLILTFQIHMKSASQPKKKLYLKEMKEKVLLIWKKKIIISETIYK